MKTSMLLTIATLLSQSVFAATDGNRLAYLDSDDPFYVSGSFPKLTTPQWIGEPGVEAVVTFGIDDMRGNHAQYETVLRPLIERLKQIDGRAPISIFCNSINIDEPHFQKWLSEGLSLEVHTLSHPCPILNKNDFEAATNTFHGGVDLLHGVRGNSPVAFRTPCCDSINSPSPRLYAEIFNRRNSVGQFLMMDSSIMNVTTEADADLAREWLTDPDGKPKFKKYLPFPSFMTTVENYPYPFVVGKLCWQMPPAVPSDWEARNILRDTNATTLADWKTGLDIAVKKRGAFNLVIHPYNWSSPAQWVALVDHAVSQHGSKVKFLNFREAHERLTTNMLKGQTLRAKDGSDNGVRLLDLNDDGFLDVIIANENLRLTRIWNPIALSWSETPFPIALTGPEGAGVRFGIVKSKPVALLRSPARAHAWQFDGAKWIEDRPLLEGLAGPKPLFTFADGRDRGARFRDVNRDGQCELIFSNERDSEILAWSTAERKWKPIGFQLPANASIVNDQGEDNGLRFVDLNEDGFDDVIHSNEARYSVHLFIPKPFLGWAAGWTRKVTEGKRGDAGEIPMIVRAGPYRNNGAWFKNRHLWVQNENTAHLPDLVDRRSFDDLIRGALPEPKSPEDSLKTIKVPDGFTVELIAHEPMIESPVALDWAADGKLYVVEFRDYPLGMDGKGAAGGVIKLLEDTNNDGRYDKVTKFLENVNTPTGISAWSNGVLITAAPNIIYAEDTDGDGRADITRVLYTGFAEGNEQHRINGFEYGLDGWFYAANGESGGTARSLANGKVVSISGRDFRIHPSTGDVEAIEGVSQFGRRRDDFGNWFGNYNAFWGWHYPIPEHYLARNTRLAAPTLRRRLANYDQSTRLYPISKGLQRFNVTEPDSHVTAASSPMTYRDDLFGAEYATSLFISEPVYNAIHREVLIPDGVSFRSVRATNEPASEFLASSDDWFRPTTLKTGPEGALYIVDMYRLILEHPEWIPDDLEAKLDVRAGADKGRIYRVYPKSATLRPAINLAKLNGASLVTALDSPNGWQRDTAQRLLVERRDRASEMPLIRLATGASDPRVRVQALWTLHLLSWLSDQTLIHALRDADPSIREHAVRLSEPFLRGRPPAQLMQALGRRAIDPAARVRFQLALTLGACAEPSAAEWLADIAITDSANVDIQHAIASSITRQPEAALQRLLAQGNDLSQLPLLRSQLLIQLAAQQKFSALAEALAKLAGRDWNSAQVAFHADLLAALAREQRSWQQVLDGSADSYKTASFMDRSVRWSQQQLAAADASTESRAAAVKFLAVAPLSGATAASLVDLLKPGASPDLQSVAMSALQNQSSAEVAGALLNAWPQLGPNIRPQVASLFLRRNDWAAQLLRALESQQIHPRDLSAGLKQQLLQSADRSLRARAEHLLAIRNSDKDAIIKNLTQGISKLSGRPDAGREVFQQQCAACHPFAGAGAGAGPDLASVVDKSAERLLAAVIDPNRAVEDRYKSYTAKLKNGEEVAGMLTSESANSVTLVGITGQPLTLLRADIQSLSTSGLSLMPEGFEQNLSAQNIADLFAFLNGASPAFKVFAGNTPATVKPTANGQIVLAAANAEVYGDTLVFESDHQNLGFWASASDRAVWTFEAPAAGLYSVALDYACIWHSSGNMLALETGDQSLRFKVASTGEWTDYKERKIGEVRLDPGQHRLSIRAEGPMRHYLLDLRTIRLTPIPVSAERR